MACSSNFFSLPVQSNSAIGEFDRFSAEIGQARFRMEGWGGALSTAQPCLWAPPDLASLGHPPRRRGGKISPPPHRPDDLDHVAPVHRGARPHPARLPSPRPPEGPGAPLRDMQTAPPP